jgi:hypothetical protein
MKTNTEIRDVVIELDAAGLDARQRRLVIEQMGHHKSLGEAAFWGLDSERDNESLHDLKGWPECECTACGCSEPAHLYGRWRSGGMRRVQRRVLRNQRCNY